MIRALSMMLLLFIAILSGCAEGSLDGMDIPAYNDLLSSRNMALSEIWAYFQKDLHHQTPETLPAYVLLYRAKASAVVDRFDTAICGRPATGGLLMKARKAVLKDYDSYLVRSILQRMNQ